MCKDLAKIASDYIDGELSTRQNLSIKLHLMMCHGCSTFIHNLKASTDLMKRHSSTRLDGDLLRQIDERVAEALNAYQPSEDDS